MPDPTVATRTSEAPKAPPAPPSGPSELDRKREALVAEQQRREKLARGDEDAGDEDVLDTMLKEDRGGRRELQEDARGVDSIDIADGWSGSLALGADQQKMEFNAPTGLKFPPPDGFSLPLAKFPIGPLGGAPVFLEIGVKLAGGVTLDDVGLALEHRGGSSDVVRQDHWAASGSGNLSASFGIEVYMAMLVGIPVVANAQAGIKAAADAEAKLAFEAGGTLDVVSTLAAPGGTSKPISKDGELYLNIAGMGSLAAELSAYLGFEFFTYKGELFQLSIASATLANLELGARFGVRYSNGDRSFFAEPIEDDYLNFEWLMGKMWRARKLDRAKSKAVEAQGDALALMDLADRPDMQVYLDDLRRSGGLLEAANGRMQLLINEQEQHERNFRADHEAIEELEKEIARLIEVDRATKAKRWKLTNKIRGDIPDLKKARKRLKRLRKDLVDKMRKAELASQDTRKAQEEFLATIDPAEIEARILAAKQRADEVHDENWGLFVSEVKREMKSYEKRFAQLRDQIAEQDRIIEVKQQEFDEGAGVQAWEDDKDAALAEEQRLADVVNEKVGSNEQLQAVLDGLGPDTSKKARRTAQKDLARGEKELRKAIAAWERAHAERLRVNMRSPLGVISEQLSKAESRRLLLVQRLEKLQQDRLEDHLEEATLLPDVPSVKPKPKPTDTGG